MMDFDDLPHHEVASDAPTEEAPPSFDSDGLIDEPIQNIGDIEDVIYDGKIKKEILEVGQGFKKPMRHHIATIIYKAYFFDHTLFDSSNGEAIPFVLGDSSWPEGLWNGIEHMRKNEKAKIKIQKKHAFGRKENAEKLRFPTGYEVEGEKRERLLKKGVIYEVKLIDWIERVDLESDGNFLKQFVVKPSKKEYEKPQDRDEVTFDLKIYQSSADQILFQKDNWETSLIETELTISLKKNIESMKRGEKNITVVKSSFIKEHDQDLIKFLGEGYDQEKDLTIEMELKKLIKVEDWFKDGGSTLKRQLRKGKGSQPNIDSIVKVFLRITVNDNQILNNFPEQDPLAALPVDLTEEQKQQIEQDPQLYTFNLDEFKLPSLMIKVLKSMKKFEVCEFITTKIDKLKTNFSNELFDQHIVFNDGDKVSITVSLIHKNKDEYFYQLNVAGKLARVQHLKTVAGNFFKIGNFQKAAKIYQKINGYYNFGDATNNYQKEDEESPEFQEKNKELLAIKILCFLNLVVCKYKLKEYQSVVNITDQVLEMDPNNVKCLYFRGLSYLELQEYDNSISALTKLCQVDPNHTDGRNALVKAKLVKKQFLDAQHKKFSKMWQ